MTQIKGTIDLRYFQERELFLEKLRRLKMSIAFTSTSPQRELALITEIELINPIDSQLRCKAFALWDTGSSVCLITKKIADKLNLISRFTREANFIGEKTIDLDSYLINLILPNNINVPNLEILNWPNPRREGIDILIGMDIISQGDFTISNFEGKTKFGFRFPSFEHIDLEAGKKVFG